jgi:glycosyltransferase involved in cell wall biosynthesis
VLDAESTDDTVAIARARGAQVETRAWEGFVAARRHALARVRTPWTLMLDADERLDPALRAAILAAPGDVAGYRLHRTTTLCGAPVRTAGWSSETLLRLFRTDRARLEANSVGGGADLHERWVVDGPSGVLAGTIVHDSYPTLASYRVKFARYTEIEAAALVPSRIALARELLLFPLRVLWSIAKYGGWRDGWRGLFVAWESARYRVVVRLGALRRA